MTELTTAVESVAVEWSVKADVECPEVGIPGFHEVDSVTELPNEVVGITDESVTCIFDVYVKVFVLFGLIVCAGFVEVFGISDTKFIG